MKNFVKSSAQPLPSEPKHSPHLNQNRDNQILNPDCGEPGVQTPDFQESGLRKNRNADCGKTGGNNTDINNTDFNDTENLSINLDGMDGYKLYLKMVKENIGYDYIVERSGKNRVDGIVNIIMDVLCSNQEQIAIGKNNFPAAVVKSRMLKLDMNHIEYVFDCLDKSTSEIQNMKAYMISSLYNAPATIDQYYSSLYNHHRTQDYPQIKGGGQNK